MIIDKTENLSMYKNLLPNLEAGLQAVQALGSNMEVGKYDFEGGYFMIQEGETRPVEDGDYEAHRKYLDVQIMVSGGEQVAWSDATDLAESGEYDMAKDKVMFSGAADHVFLVSEGMSWVAFPHDAHKACRDTGKKMHYKKIVMKLPIA